MSNRKLILYISCSLDGYIAKHNDDLSFLERVQVEGLDYGYYDFMAGIDAVIVGKRTYDWVLKQGYAFPHADKESYIITRSSKAAEGNVNFYTGELEDLVNTLKSKNGKNIFCDGGAFVVNAALKKRLFDELIISVIPVLLGDGIKLFANGNPEQDLELVSSESFNTGLVQLHYKIAK